MSAIAQSAISFGTGHRFVLSRARRETGLLYVSSLSSTRARFLFLSRWNNFCFFFLVIQIKFSFPRMTLTNTCSFYLSRIKNQLRRAPSLPLRPRRETLSRLSLLDSTEPRRHHQVGIQGFISQKFLFFVFFVFHLSSQSPLLFLLQVFENVGVLTLSLSLSYFIK